MDAALVYGFPSIMKALMDCGISCFRQGSCEIILIGFGCIMFVAGISHIYGFSANLPLIFWLDFEVMNLK